jgi:membrane-associated phospholipid phosphatase
MPRRLLALTIGIALVSGLGIAPSVGAAQERPPAAGGSPDSATVRVARMPSARSTLRTVGALALVTVAAMPVDARLARALRSPAPQRSAFLQRSARVANAAGDPGAVVGSLALYVVGRLARNPTATTLGLHAGEAIVLGGTSTAVIKLLAGRQRPYVEAGDADDFAPGHGAHGARESFPSGHTTAAFALASAVSAELRRTHPAAARVATPLLYAGAASVGLARMYDDRHWASDVVLGAGLGTLAGTRVVAFSRAHPNNWVDRHLGALTVAPDPGGRGLLLGLHLATR